MDRMRRLDVGAVLFGLIVLGIGVYYLFENTFGFALPELDWDKIWPLAIMALGIALLWGAWARMGGGQGTHSA